jgi:hypothetical protein
MNFLLWAAERQLPDFIRRRELNRLFRLTASSFGLEVPPAEAPTADERLAEYARFTKDAVDRCIGRGADARDVQERLFERSREYGSLWRRRFGVSNMKDVMRAGRILYRAMGIEFHGTEKGSVEIAGCFFSRSYSPATCRMISSIDAGIMAGLSGGKILTFSRRITEGSDICEAQLRSKEMDA